MTPPTQTDGRPVVAVFGGSFNPPHVVHAMMVAWVRWAGVAERVWMVPAFVHPFGKELAPFDQRVGWCRALAQDVGGVDVVEIERELPPPSYTAHTLDALASRHPGVCLRLLVGADVLAQVGAWHRWEHIVDRYRPVVVGRVGYGGPEGVPVFPGVSSTEVRERLARGLPVQGLVTRSVAELLPRSLVEG